MITTLPDGRAFCDCGCEFCLMNPERTLGLPLDEALKLGGRTSLTIDFRDPALQGGGWLQEVRDAAEQIRRVRRKPRTKPKN